PPPPASPCGLPPPAGGGGPPPPVSRARLSRGGGGGGGGGAHQRGGGGGGRGVFSDRHYRRIATVHGGNGLDIDLHEFLVTNQGDAYVLSAAPVTVPGSTRPLVDSVVQEIDIKTGLVMFEWHALDHVKLSESYKYGSGVT